MSHQPFPIANIETGMYLAKEPWLSPNNAFQEVADAYVFRSRVHRRNGFQRFSSCGVASASGYSKTDTGGGIWEYTLTTVAQRITPESVDLVWNDPINGNLNATVDFGSFGWQDFNGFDGWGWTIVETGTSTQLGVVFQRWLELIGALTIQRGATAKIIWNIHSGYTGLDVATPDGSMTWSEDPELPIVGVAAYKTTAGDEYLIALNTTRVFLYNTTSGWFDDSTGADQFTGTSADLFWTWPLGDDLLVTNGVDRVKKYNGPGDTLVNMGTTLSAGVVDSARLVIFYRNRVIYLNTVENSTTRTRRARWSRAGAYETLDDEDFADAPTELGAIVTVEFVADRIMVGFQKGWMELVYTKDPQSLFEWEKTTSVYGATAKLGAIADGARILARTENGIEALDPNQQYAADAAIPDYVIDKLDTSNSGATYGTRNIPLKQFWWTVVSSVAATDAADEILVAQYQEDQDLSWSRYRIPFNCFAEFRSEAGSNWDDIDAVWNDHDDTWDSAANLSGFPVVLAGHENGVIYQSLGSKDHLDDYPYDADNAILFDTVGPQPVQLEVKTQRLSPFPGQESQLGWVDFYMDASPDVTITVEFRGNSRLAAYKTASFSLTPSGANEKVYRRVKVNKKATFHSMTIKAEGGGSFAIDAIVPWFRPAGRMRVFG